MMNPTVRKIVSIDKAKCNGCGACVAACHEGAMQMVDGKAELVSDIYCDGLGDCLGPCPTGALSIIQRSADAYDEDAAEERKNRTRHEQTGGGCPGSMAKALKPLSSATAASAALPCGCPGSLAKSLRNADAPSACDSAAAPAVSELMNWPVQLKLVPASAPYLKGADILLAADCVPVAVPDFHRRFLRNKPVIIACPKLDENEPQALKLAEILKAARPASLTVARMEVPCCGALVRVARRAVELAGTDTPIYTVIAAIGGSDDKSLSH